MIIMDFDDFRMERDALKRIAEYDILWRLLPFLFTAVIVWLQFKGSGGNDITVYVIFMPFVIFLSLGFFTIVSYAVQSSLCPNRKELQTAGSQVVKIFLVVIFAFFLALSALAIIGIAVQKTQTEQQQYYQPASLSPGTFNYNLLTFLDSVTGVMFVIPMGALLLAVTLLVRSLLKKEKQTKKQIRIQIGSCVLLFMIPILSIFILSWPLKSITRHNVKNFLAGALPDAGVKINDHDVADAKTLIYELSQVKTFVAHHSHATRMIRIDIESSGDTLTLNVGQDSSYSDEFWVYYPAFRHTRANEIGRIRSKVFEEYFKTLER